jgi:hypothetical protein
MEISLDVKNQLPYDESISITEVRMHLSCRKALILASVVTIACRDSTSPSPFAGSYFLSGVNDLQLPAMIYSTPDQTITVISAELTLTNDGKAILAERKRVTYQGTTTEPTSTITLKYRLSGDYITIGSFTMCPANAVCIGDFVGQFSGSSLNLQVGMLSQNTPLVYVLQREDPLAQ